MKRITVRIPNWVKDEMDRRSDINWSQKVRDYLIEYLKKEDFPIDFRNIIQEYKNNKNWDILKAIYLYAVETERQALKTNLSIIFGVRLKEIEIELYEIFKKLGIKCRLENVQEQNFNDIIIKILFEEGIIDDLEGDVNRLFESIEVRDQIAKAIWHLGLYLDDKTEDIYIHFDGDHLRILFSHIFKNPEKIIRELIKIGILFESYYSSNAYSYKEYKLSSHSFKLIRDIQENPSKYSLLDRDLKKNIAIILSEKRYRTLLKRLDSWFDLYSEDIREYKMKFNEQYYEGAFDDTLNELIEKGLVICSYWPSRKRLGKRMYKPASLTYEISEVGKKNLYELKF